MLLRTETCLSMSVVLLATISAPLRAQQVAAPVCVHDASIVERFLPVELMNGLPMTDSRELTFQPVDRTYTFIDELPDGRISGGDVKLKGPTQWTGAGGTVYEVYERQVPRARELYAMTADRTAVGRVYDQRIGSLTNEGKYPIGPWKQGEKRSYDTLYHSTGGARPDVSTLEIEKLSCTWEGIAGAMQYAWKTSRQSYGYIYAPGRGIVQVMTRAAGR